MISLVVPSHCLNLLTKLYHALWPVVSFAKEVNPRLAKRPLVFNGRLANRWLTSLVKEATGVKELTTPQSLM